MISSRGGRRSDLQKVSAYVNGQKGGDHTRFEDFSFPKLAMWGVNCLFGAVIPAHGYPELTHPGTAHRIRGWGKKETHDKLTALPTGST